MKFQKEFDKWYKHMKGAEGGYVDDKFDKGGKTNKGVILSTYLYFANYLGTPKTLQGLKDLSDANHRKIALAYWNNAKPNFFNSGRLAAFFAEEFWGAGTGVTKFYQRKLNLSYNANLRLDGAIGKNTISAINNADSEEQMWKFLCAMKRERYSKIWERDATQLRFKKGWIARYLRFEKLFETKAIIEQKAPQKEVIKEKTKIDKVLEQFGDILLGEFGTVG